MPHAVPQPYQSMADGFERAAMLECEGGDNRSILRVGFGSAPNLAAVYEDLSDAAVVEPTDAAGVKLTPGFEPVEPVRPAVLKPLTGDWRGHASDSTR
jgi:hypothetical protein